jgi:hypothetical protein
VEEGRATYKRPVLAGLFYFSQPLAFATILSTALETGPKTYGSEAATRILSILLGGSLIQIVVIGMGMVLPRKGVLWDV